MARKNALLLGGLLLLPGGLIRLSDFTDLPLDFHPTRQLFSALKARGMCYAQRTDLPEWQREQAIRQWETQATIEPTIMERQAQAACRSTGNEAWLAGRAFSILFWLVGGIGLWQAARQGYKEEGVLLAPGIYLFLPYGIYASRSFQPDPLMVGLMALYFWGLAGYNLLANPG